MCNDVYKPSLWIVLVLGFSRCHGAFCSSMLGEIWGCDRKCILAPVLSSRSKALAHAGGQQAAVADIHRLQQHSMAAGQHSRVRLLEKLLKAIEPTEPLQYHDFVLIGAEVFLAEATWLLQSNCNGYGTRGSAFQRYGSAHGVDQHLAFHMQKANSIYAP